MLIFVCSFVCSMKVCLELSIFILKQSGSVPGQSQVSLRSVSGQSQFSVSDQSQVSPRVSLRSVSGPTQVSPRSVLGLSELTLSLRRSLKYFVLFVSCLK